MKVRKRGDMYQVDITAIPAGEHAPVRFRLTAPRQVTSRSGAERWGKEQWAKIVKDGRPYNNRVAREQRRAEEEEARRLDVPTFAAFWPTFLEHLRAERRKPNTIETYEKQGQRHVLPIFGAMRLDHVTDVDVQRLKASMVTTAASTANIALTVLGQLLKLAKTHHPGVTIPAIRRVRDTAGERLRFYTHEQADALVAAVAQHPERRLMLLLGLDAGLRKNEAHALRWCDVDLARGELSIRHSLCGGALLSPKSGRSRRVPVTRRLSAALAGLERESEWVLPRSTHSQANRPLTMDAVLAWAAKRAGVPYLGPHALRHSYACHALAAGGDLQAVSRMLGHANVGITARVYAHFLPGADRAAVNKLENARLVTSASQATPPPPDET